MKTFEEMADEAGDSQLQRAWRCARELAGERTTRPIVRAMLALVEAVEKDGGVAEPISAPPADARKVLAPKQKTPKSSQRAAKPIQEGLW